MTELKAQTVLSDTSCDGQSSKRSLNSNVLTNRKRLREEEDMECESGGQERRESEAEEEEEVADEEEEREVEEDWKEMTPYERLLLTIENELDNIRLNLKVVDWSVIDDDRPQPPCPPPPPKTCDGFPPKVGEVFFGYRFDRIVCVGKRLAIFVGHYLKTDSNEELILKVGVERGFHSLLNEWKSYTRLKALNCRSIPTFNDFIFWKVNSDDYTSVHWALLVVEPFGSNVWDVMRKHIGTSAAMDRVFAFAIQMIDAIEEMHEKGYIHRSLKPEHFVMDTNARLRLIGLSAARCYMVATRDGRVHMSDEKDWRKIPFGDPNFHSIGYHKGFKRSRRDDMESLGYCIVYIARGSLPWIRRDGNLFSAKTIQRIGDRMQSTSIGELCFGLPQNIVKYFGLIDGYEFKERPNYEELRQLFRTNV